MLTKENIIRKLEQHQQKIRSFGVTKLTLFGSYARDEATKGSDIDFLVEFAPGRGLFKDSVHLLQFLRDDMFKCKVDLIKPTLIREELRESILGGTKVEAKI